LKERGVPFVYTLWHGRMVLCILAHLHEGIVTMASRSKDGEIIARWLIRNGYIPARGSTGKGGRAALQDMIDCVRAGHPAALTVDGPKGPPRVVQPGILRLAQETARVDPFWRGYAALVSRSWDRHPFEAFALRRRLRQAVPVPRNAEARRWEDRARCGRDHPRSRPKSRIAPPPWNH
jgi:lysophospholipid acyltransferase (LPLAT)-like uncharacterized protein